MRENERPFLSLEIFIRTERHVLIPYTRSLLHGTAASSGKLIYAFFTQKLTKYFKEAIKQKPSVLMDTLIEKIILYNDKNEIYFNSPL